MFNNFSRVITLFFAILINQSAFSQDVQEGYELIKISLQNTSIRQIAELGIEADHGYVAPGRYLVNYLNKEERTLLSQNKILFNKIDPSELDFLNTRSENCDPGSSGDHPDPVNFRLGKMGGYYTLQEMNSILDSMKLLYPGLISSKADIDTFKTVEGRPIQYVRISDKPDTTQLNKPKILFTALHHSREPMGLSQMIYFMWDILEQYGSNPEIKQLVDQSEIYFVPCLNPDGYEYNYSIRPNGGGMWRKNRRLNSDGTKGVDLNRNYGLTWGFDDLGSSNDPSSETYRGTEAFSEMETRAMKSLIEKLNFSLALNYHTFGSYLIHPWSHIDEPCPDDHTFKNIGRTYAQQNNFAIGTAQETVGYKTNGGSDDWTYAHDGAQKVFSMTPELGLQSEGFWPNIGRIRDLAKTTLVGNQLYVKMAHRYFEVTVRDPKFAIYNIENSYDVSINRIGVEEGPVQLNLKVITDNATLGQSEFLLDMEVSEQKNERIVIIPNPDIEVGDVISVEFFKQMGAISELDTLEFQVVGSSTGNSNPCDDIATVNVEGNTWGLDFIDYYSAPSSFSDSPSGNYNDFQLGGIVFDQEYVIPAEGRTILSCWLKWDIEANYDYGQLYAVTEDGNVPLCGRYTKTGTSFQDPGDPVYDGNSVQWLREEISLDMFAGQTIHIGAKLVSDQMETRDGIYIDDVEVKIFSKEVSMVGHAYHKYISIYPNPATTELNIESQDIQGSGDIFIKNYLGITCLRQKYNEFSKTTIDISNLPVGVYLIEIVEKNGHSTIKKWIRS